jgi:hypothetical protein
MTEREDAWSLILDRLPPGRRTTQPSNENPYVFGFRTVNHSTNLNPGRADRHLVAVRPPR